MRGRAKGPALLVLLVVLMVPGSARGTVTIGSNLGRVPDFANSCSSCTLVQSTLVSASAAPFGIASPVNGTVTVWRIRTASTDVIPTTLRVIRPLGGNLFTGAGASATITPPVSATTPYATRLPIAIGDKIGLDIGGSTNAMYFVTNPGGTRDHFIPALLDGGVGRSPTANFPNLEIAINADIEPTATLSGVTAKPRKGGRVKVSVRVPNPGTLAAGDSKDTALRVATAAKKRKLLKLATARASAPASVSLVVKPTKAAKALLADGKRPKVKLKLVFTPTGGSPSSQPLKVRLKR
jgi:hypothetical protein